MKVITSTFVILSALLLGTQQANAEEARVACKNFIDQVTIHQGQCPFGQTLIKVFDSPSTPSRPSEDARVACKNFLGQVTVHNGQCPFGEELVKVMD